MTDVMLIVLGASWGGTRAISALLETLPETFPVPIAVLLHRGRDNLGPAGALEQAFQEHSRLSVREVEDKMPIACGVYLAPGDYHLLVEGDHFALSIDPPVQYARPSIDVAFESASEAFRDALVGVLLTGTGQDGAQGMVAIKRHGGLTVAQAPDSAERGEMPEAAIAARVIDHILPLEAIGPFLRDRCGVR